VGIPARIIEAGLGEQRERAAEKMGFSAYGISADMNDPVVQAIHGLLDHMVNIDARMEQILLRLEQAGIRLELEKDGFDPSYLNRIVD
jgi:serine O-acetyltransferase